MTLRAKSTERQDGRMTRAPRLYVHPDQRFLSVGFADTNDTLLVMPEGWHDRERVVEWVAAIKRTQELLALVVDHYSRVESRDIAEMADLVRGLGLLFEDREPDD